jgi:hypothetical protein
VEQRFQQRTQGQLINLQFRLSIKNFSSETVPFRANPFKMSDVPAFPDLAPSNDSILDRILQQLDLNEQWQQQHQQPPPQEQDAQPQQQQQQQQEEQQSQAPQQQQFIFGPPSQNLFQFGAMPTATGSPAQPPARRLGGGRLQKKQVQQPQQPKKRGKRCA